MSPDRRRGRRLGGPGASLTISPRRKAREREIERLNRLYATLCGLNQSIVRVKSREELFREVCRITVVHAGFQVVWVGWHDRETHELRPVARAGDSADYLDKIKVYADERPEGRGPVGLCIRSGKPCIVDDFVHDPRTTPWREAAIAHGLLSVAALPIQVNGEVCGAFVVYAGERAYFRTRRSPCSRKPRQPSPSPWTISNRRRSDSGRKIPCASVKLSIEL